MSLTLEKINEQNLGIQYLQGDLSEEQQTEFEIFLMENPEYLDELELLKVFNENLEDAEVPSLESTRTKKLSFLQIFGGMAFGALATVVLYTGTDRNTPAYAVSEIYYLETMRSSAAVLPTVKLPEKDGLILMSTPLNPEQSGKITLKLIDTDSNKTLLTLNGLTSNSMGEIAFTIPSKIFSEGNYTLLIKDSNGNESGLNFKTVN